MSTVTPEQQAAIQELYKQYQVALLPAKLEDIDANGSILRTELQKRGISVLNATVDDLLSITKAILFENKLQWLVEPKQLKLQTESQKPSKVEKLVDFELKRESDARAQEAAEAQKKKSSEAYQTARAAVDSYAPLKPGPYGRIDFKEKGETQDLVRNYIDKNEANNVDGQGTLEQVSKYLRERYEAIERKGQGL